MANFKRAFSKGIEASTEAEDSRTEIHRVFDDFAKQVKEASKGVLEVSQSRDRKPKDSGVSVRADVQEMTEHDALIATVAGAKGKTRPCVVLCEYELGALGYPVTLIYDDNDVTCGDKLSVEQEMESLLSAPSTGTKLRQLMEGHESAKPAAASAAKKHRQR